MDLKIILVYMAKARLNDWVVSYDGLFTFCDEVKKEIEINPDFNLYEEMEIKKNVSCM